MNRSNTFKNIQDILPSMMVNPSGGRKKINRSRQSAGLISWLLRVVSPLGPGILRMLPSFFHKFFSRFSCDFPWHERASKRFKILGKNLPRKTDLSPLSPLSRISDSPSPPGWGSLGSTKRAGRTRSSHATGSSASGGNRSLLEPPQKMDKMMNMMKTAWL